MTRVSSTPLNFRDARGRWRAIDDTLVARDGAFAARADAHGVRLPRRLSEGVMVSAGRERFSMRLMGAAGSAAVRGARARYRDVLPGVSAVYDAQSTGLREQLVLSDRRVPRSFRFRLRVSRGLRARLTRGGSVVFSRGQSAVFVLPASVAFPQHDPTDRHAARSRLQRTGSRWSLQRGPVVVDPTIEIDSDSQTLKFTSEQ